MGIIGVVIWLIGVNKVPLALQEDPKAREHWHLVSAESAWTLSGKRASEIAFAPPRGNLSGSVGR